MTTIIRHGDMVYADRRIGTKINGVSLHIDFDDAVRKLTVSENKLFLVAISGSITGDRELARLTYDIVSLMEKLMYEIRDSDIFKPTFIKNNLTNTFNSKKLKEYLIDENTLEHHFNLNLFNREASYQVGITCEDKGVIKVVVNIANTDFCIVSGSGASAFYDREMYLDDIDIHKILTRIFRTDRHTSNTFDAFDLRELSKC